MLTDAAKTLRSLVDDRSAEQVCRELFTRAGVSVNGSAPDDIQVNDSRLYGRILRDGTLGFGEAYLDGWWDSEALDQLATKLLRAQIDVAVSDNWNMMAHVLKAKLFNLQSSERAYEVGERHYDIGNDLYAAMLDATMAYTCGYWKNATTLDEAQEAKLDLVCRKIRLEPGTRVLELGCGWGSFAKFAAERYGAHVTGLTVSKEQVELAQERCAGLPVDIRLDDYRHARGRFDAVVSIGIMEHVGYKNHRTYMETAARCLEPDGVAFIHTIGSNTSLELIDPWFHKYIFPNAHAPSIAQVGKAMEGLFVLEDVHNFGPDYDRTLMAWYDNFERAWPELRAKYGGRFYRMWRYYLLSSAASFRARHQQLYHVVMTKPGTPQRDFRKS